MDVCVALVNNRDCATSSGESERSESKSSDNDDDDDLPVSRPHPPMNRTSRKAPIYREPVTNADLRAMLCTYVRRATTLGRATGVPAGVSSRIVHRSALLHPLPCMRVSEMRMLSVGLSGPSLFLESQAIVGRLGWGPANCEACSQHVVVDGFALGVQSYLTLRKLGSD